MTTFWCSGHKDALIEGKPEIFNTDQGSQFTSLEFTECLESSGIESVWMVKSALWIIFLLRDYGDLLSTNMSI